MGPCSTGFPCWLRFLGTHLYHCTSWCCCERLCLASVNFFEDSFNAFFHVMMGDLRAHLPTLRWVFASFWQKNCTTPVPHLPYSPVLLQSDFFFVSLDEKSPQRKTFCLCGRAETKKMAETLKGIKINDFKNFFEQWKKCLDRYIASNGEHWRVTEIETCKNKYTIFINKFLFCGPSLYMHNCSFQRKGGGAKRL